MCHNLWMERGAPPVVSTTVERAWSFSFLNSILMSVDDADAWLNEEEEVVGVEDVGEGQEKFFGLVADDPHPAWGNAGDFKQGVASV